LALADETSQERARVSVSTAGELSEPVLETPVLPTTRSDEVRPAVRADGDAVATSSLRPSRHVTAEYLG
jgi:hypothetical protein